MKIKYTLLSLLAILLSLNANAETCGKLISNRFVPMGDYAVKLEKHNDKRLNIPSKGWLATSDLEASGFISLYLEPGLHSFSGYAVCAQSYCKQSRIYGGSEADEINFFVNVEEGMTYKIAAKPISPRNLLPGKRFEVFLMKEEPSDCQSEEAKDALPAQSDINKEQLVASL